MSTAITYHFHENDGIEIKVELSFDPVTFRAILPANPAPPAWTLLDDNKCSNCPLESKTTKRCPTALAFATFLPNFANDISHHKAVIEVETANRIVVSKTTMQSGIASLMGLAFATSGCPHTEFLRPMARYHLPFADEQETVFRSLGTWLLTEFIRTNGDAPINFDGLKEAYSRLNIVNAALVERLRSAVTRDAALNAVIILDTFALIAPENADYGFDDIRNIIVV